ncbi:MAG: hypothetical protein FWD22_02580, partial [Treponema sp.]|nr:hypothetical protein [Treponema sp.]
AQDDSDLTPQSIQAQLLEVEQFISKRAYHDAIASLDKISMQTELPGNAQIRADVQMLRLRTLRGMATGYAPGYDTASALAQFRSQVLIAMDRFPRDTRPLRIFFEYARNKKPEPSELPESDSNLMELILRRLPFLLESDPELAWMAAPFISDIEAARRLVAAYIAGLDINQTSIPVALNLGVIDDREAVELLFTAKGNGEFYLCKDVIIDTYNLLRSEEGRELFTQNLHSFSGIITRDEDRDGYIDSQVVYIEGSIQFFNYSNYYDFLITFEHGGIPQRISTYITGDSSQRADLKWERYPYVEYADTGKEYFTFSPADFQYAPVTFIELGGSRNITGLLYPMPAYQYLNLTRYILISFCTSITRPSLEIDNVKEKIYMSRGVILQAIETIDEQQVSVTEFERGLPVIQHIDLDLDGRMETIRRFRRPPQDYTWEDLLDYRRLIASSESDWAGDGLFKTMEVYLPDGSVVYSFDMEGSGEMNYSETGNR